jgi:hypothetical protein
MFRFKSLVSFYGENCRGKAAVECNPSMDIAGSMSDFEFGPAGRMRNDYFIALV